jgi:hypothetical protein
MSGTTAGALGFSIPPFNHSGVLPPYLGSDPGQTSAGMSPYISSVDEVVSRFNTSAERRNILRGYLEFRRQLRNIGLIGWQWLDGSFLENVELNESRAPRDLDVVTFIVLPSSIQTVPQLQLFFQQNIHLFDRDQTKASFLCDAFFVDLRIGPYEVVRQARYWFGLFSHQRVTAVWKGMVEVTLSASDSDVAARAAVGLS